MGRKYISQKKQTNEELFESLVKNAIDFIDSALDNLNTRPKNSIVDFYTAIELFMKARLMREHWTLIISKAELANKDSFQVGDFHSISLEEAFKRLKNVLDENLDERLIKNFKALGEHRNQIVHFAHSNYTDLQKNRASVVGEQWVSWHYLHQLLTKDWQDFFRQYLREFDRIHHRMLNEREFIKVRFIEIQPEIENQKNKGNTILKCGCCNMNAAIAGETNKWGVNYECLVCGVEDTILKATKEAIPCYKCGTKYEFFNKQIDSCPNCKVPIDTENLINECEKKYIEGDDWWEDGAPHIAYCHQCRYKRPSVFYIDGLWSCVSCFDRGWQAINCPNCDKFVTGDMDTIKYFACWKCEDEVREQYRKTLSDKPLNNKTIEPF